MIKGNLAAALSEVIKEAGGGDIDEQEAGVLLLRMFARAGTDRCFVKAANDEPLFILRAHDRVAPATVRDWAQRARNVGSPEGKWGEGMECALAMEAWAKVHGSKDPD